MKTETTRKSTPADVVFSQVVRIQEAAELLEQHAKNTIDGREPDNMTWADVSRLAHVADVADLVIETLGNDQ